MFDQVVVFSDFDGTITGRAGKKLVFTPFYQSLLIGYKDGEINWEYKDTPMISEEQLLARFTEKFGPYNPHIVYSKVDCDILISNSAVEFFHRVLKNPHVKVSVITKNRIEYTNALFKYQGFNEEEIKNLHIIDKYLYNKGFEVQSQLSALPEKADWIYILDDDEVDFASMCEGAQNSGYLDQQIRKYNLSPGAFDWATYLVDIEHLTSLKKHSENPQTESNASSTTSVSGEEGRVVRRISSCDSETSSEGESSRNESLPNPMKDEPNLSAETVVKKNQPPKLKGLFAMLSFVFGFALGIASVASGVFAPFGLSFLGALGLGLATGSGFAVVSAQIGYDIANSSEADIDDAQLHEHSTVIGSHAIALHLFSPSTQEKIEPTEPGQYASMFAMEADGANKRTLPESPDLSEGAPLVSKQR
ncbi:sulfite exporter TauE/SafE family protein [Legionella waltersii]|uniref:Dot/Icm T4SS effector n=1 Tax=Legionella waltersii TaxID=66969 RepID=A0A0W1A5Y0_9GAMM|nr:sulfite exporter TauE/SafE family protein [Legionella waltersii]KTD76608.1 Dot/Icm T4SS effector [Legionella waltersii]SNU94617.1 Dot/Icm T4SS effector [Legionella waltersii]